MMVSTNSLTSSIYTTHLPFLVDLREPKRSQGHLVEADFERVSADAVSDAPRWNSVDRYPTAARRFRPRSG